MEFEVIFYETENGQKPVEDFLLSLNTKMRTKMVQMMEILEDCQGRVQFDPFGRLKVTQ